MKAVVLSLEDCQVPTIILSPQATPATDCSELELASCGATVSGYMDCLDATDSSATYLSTPRLLTTND